MKNISKILMVVAVLGTVGAAKAESSYSVSEYYAMEQPSGKLLAITDNSRKASKVEYLLSPTRLDKGKYVVEVKKIADNLYRVRNSDICVETRYCNEYVSYWEEVVLIVDSSYGYTKGKLIFD